MMRKRITTYGVCTILSSLLAVVACKEAPAPAPPPPAVKAAEVLVRDVPIYLEAIGQTRGNTEIEIRARVEGYLESVDFSEGTLVRKGSLLYTIDPRPLEAALAQAKANLARAEADLQRAHQDVVLYEPLVAKNAISRQQYDTAVAVERAQASAVEAAKASVESAELDLSYTRVTAPDPGIVGKTEVYPGTLVGRGQSTLLTQISKVDPINIRFTFPSAATSWPREGTRSEGPPPTQTCPSSSCWPTGRCTRTPGASCSSTAPSTRGPARSCSRRASPTPGASCGPDSTGACGRRSTSRRTPSSFPSARS
jgi:multidrug efflux pump subunit AcrA (membrane-fusion protein)